MTSVCVLGGGSFGTALADLLARRGLSVRWWMRDPEHAQAVRRTGRNPRYLSEMPLAAGITPTADLAEALRDAAWAIAALPSQALRPTLERARGPLGERPLVIAAKGIEVDSLMTMEEVAADVLGAAARSRLLALSGPSFAREIMQGHPTAVVLACRDEALAERIAAPFFCDNFRAYTSPDVVGVEMGGALKNVMAIAAGVVSGLGFGDNTRAALVTRGLAEITRLSMAKGAHPMTLAGLAGLGDLVLTCTGALSRNRAVGFALGQGRSLEEALASVKETAEGVVTARSAYLLSQRLGVEARIIRAVYQGLYEGVSVREAVTALVRRPPGSELE